MNPWVGVVNRSQADINRNVDIVAARRKEREYFQSSPDYGHLASRMGSEYLAKLLSKVSMPSILLRLALLWALNIKGLLSHITMKKSITLSVIFCCISYLSRR